MADLEPSPQESAITTLELEVKQEESTPSGGDEEQNQSETNETPVKNDKNDKLKEKSSKRGGNRFEPYSTNRNARFRVFVSNIPFEMKWQTLKDLMREKEWIVLKINRRNDVKNFIPFYNISKEYMCEQNYR